MRHFCRAVRGGAGLGAERGEGSGLGLRFVGSVRVSFKVEVWNMVCECTGIPRASVQSPVRPPLADL